jgi:hypothetical protein
MINNPISSLHLESSGISEEPNDLSHNASAKTSPKLLNLSPNMVNGSQSLSEKKLALLRQLLLLQKQSKMHEIGDPSLLLDENFELSPKNYSKLLEYMKLTAQKLNEAITQSSENLSKALGLSPYQEKAKIPVIPNLQHYNSIDSNSTMDSDQGLIQHPGNGRSPRQTITKQRGENEISQFWVSENDSILNKLAQKYHRDWNKISRVFSSLYHQSYKPESLRSRYMHLLRKNETVKNARKKLQEFEEFPKNLELDYQNYQAPPCIKRVKQEHQMAVDDMIGYEAMENGHSEQKEIDHAENYPLKDSERESVKVFYTKNEHLESKTLELPWINFDFERDFGQEDELFERVTSCYN